MFLVDRKLLHWQISVSSHIVMVNQTDLVLLSFWIFLPPQLLQNFLIGMLVNYVVCRNKFLMSSALAVKRSPACFWYLTWLALLSSSVEKTGCSTVSAATLFLGCQRKPSICLLLCLWEAVLFTSESIKQFWHADTVTQVETMQRSITCSSPPSQDLLACAIQKS